MLPCVAHRQLAAQGDLRQALHSVHFAALGSAEAPTRQRRRKKQSSRSPLSSAPSPHSAPSLLRGDDGREMATAAVYGRDVSYSLMHAVGKLLFGKAELSVEDVIERSVVAPSTLLSFVQANYLRHLSADDELAHVQQAAHHLSTADLLDAQQRRLTFGDVRGSRTTRHCSQRTPLPAPSLTLLCCPAPSLLLPLLDAERSVGLPPNPRGLQVHSHSRTAPTTA